MNKYTSFRDPENFVTTVGNKILRVVRVDGVNNYKALIGSGLFEDLVSRQLLISHKEVNFPGFDKNCIVLEVDRIPFITYSYEWSFNQFKDAAITTLNIMKHALQHGMILKDSSSFNIQFVNTQPIFIDTGSFKVYKDGEPWAGYKQFCEHFLGPLLLMSKVDVRLQKLLVSNIDGIPLDLVNKLLGIKSITSLSSFIHINLHSKFIKKYSSQHRQDGSARIVGISKSRLEALIDNLNVVIESLVLNKNSQWGDYCANNNYNPMSSLSKYQAIERFLSITKPRSAIDVGANDGTYTHLLERYASTIIAADVDPVAINNLYVKFNSSKTTNVYPVLIDLANPSSSIGWQNKERISFIERCQFDLTLCLAVVHHLFITFHIPFERIAELFSTISRDLIIEFPAPADSQVKFLLKSADHTRAKMYQIDHFIDAFTIYYELIEQLPIEGAERFIFLMKAK